MASSPSMHSGTSQWEPYPDCTAIPIAHMNPTSSRAIAVTAIFRFLQRPASARYLEQSRGGGVGHRKMATSTLGPDRQKWGLLRLSRTSRAPGLVL